MTKRFKKKKKDEPFSNNAHNSKIEYTNAGTNYDVWVYDMTANNEEPKYIEEECEIFNAINRLAKWLEEEYQIQPKEKWKEIEEAGKKLSLCDKGGCVDYE